ncbi:MAG: TIGR04211 family SH3 domain-containing protein [Desulfobacterales bacterium]
MTRMPAGKTLSIVLYTTVFILAALIVSAHADTRYVSDMLVISVRDAPIQNASVLGYIKTPTAVDILEEQGDYLKIKTKDGLEGWVLAKYIVPEKPKTLIIEDLKKQIEELKKEGEITKSKPNTLSDASSETTEKYENKIRELEEQVAKNQKLADKAGRDFMDLDKKYKALLLHSGNTDQLIKEMNRLKKANTQLNAEITTLKKNTGSPLKSRKIQLFIAGAGVLLIGMMLGGAAKKKKRFKLT